VANRPVYAAIGVTVDGCKDVLGLWMGVGGEGAKFWMSVLTDLRNRGVRDLFFLVCDGLKGLPDVVEHVWPQAVVQTSSVHNARAEIVSVVTAPSRAEPMQTRHLRGPNADPFARDGGRLRIGQREQRPPSGGVPR
jgi:transposase-like protein